jgi:hypothetical protein
MTTDLTHNAKRFGLTLADLDDERIKRLLERKIALEVKVDAIKTAGAKTRDALFIKVAAGAELTQADLARRPVADLVRGVANTLVFLAQLRPAKTNPISSGSKPGQIQKGAVSNAEKR